jgi:hypothetical protein
MTETDPVLEHRRALGETVEALKTKLARATDSMEHARDRMQDTTDFLREHRWSAMAACAALGLMAGLHRRTYQLPPPRTEHVRRASVLAAAFTTLGTLLLREVATRAIEALEARIRR